MDLRDSGGHLSPHMLPQPFLPVNGKGGEDLAGPYEVVEGWPKPIEEGWRMASPSASVVFSADEIVVTIAALVHLLLVAAEVSVPHGTAHAHLATHELAWGEYRGPFWLSSAFILFAGAAPWIAAAATPLALLGLLAYEHAYVRAGQCVALA